MCVFCTSEILIDGGNIMTGFPKYVKTMTCTSMIISICILCLLATPILSMAEDFPARDEGQYVIAPQSYATERDQEINALLEEFDQHEREYVLVITGQEALDASYAQKLFDQYKLGDQAILFVVDTAQPEDLRYAYGSFLVEQGFTDEQMDVLIETVYVPLVVENVSLTGIRSLPIQIEGMHMYDSSASVNELLMSSGEQEEQNSAVATESSPASFPWLALAFFLVVLGAIYILASFAYRRWINKQIVYLESWKENLSGWSFTRELDRAKHLNVSEDMQQSIDQWQLSWKDIMRSNLPLVEEWLLDVEEEASLIMFWYDHKKLASVKVQLTETEQLLNDIIKEIEVVTSSEKLTRERYELIREQWHLTASALHKKSIDLGIAYPVLHETDKELRELFRQCQQYQNEGYYEKAEEVLVVINEKLEELKASIEHMPEIIYAFDYTIPEETKKIRETYDRLKEQGFAMGKTGIVEQLKSIDNRRSQIALMMENSHIEDLKQWKHDIMQALDLMSSTLTDEIESREYVLTHIEDLEDKLLDVDEAVENIDQQIERVKQSYSWDSDNEGVFQQIKAHYAEMKEVMSHCQIPEAELLKNYASLQPKMKRFFEHYDQIFILIHTFSQTLNHLREDELKAGSLAQELTKSVVRLKSVLRKSNLPGLPEYLRSSIRLAEEAVQELEQSLEHVPLDMNRVEHHCKDAESQVKSLALNIESVIDAAIEAELIIQYANRYRRTSDKVRAIIEEAEQSFRSFDYQEALDFVAEALDMVDKDWRDKIHPEKHPVS